MNPVDLHILRSPDWPPRLLERALDSTEGQPVNVFVVPFTGREGNDRAHAYRQGSAPYVAFLDADDELLPGGLAALVAALDADPTLCGAYGGEERVTPAGTVTLAMDTAWSAIAQITRASALHAGALMRRAAVRPHLHEIAAYPARSNRLLRGLITQFGPWRAVQVPVYRWHQRAGTLHTRSFHETDRNIIQRLAPLLMQAHARTARG